VSIYFLDSSALVKRYAQEQGINQSLPTLTLIAADRDLLAAAASEGLPTDDPNQHP
jgi:hypothetical protein